MTAKKIALKPATALAAYVEPTVFAKLTPGALRVAFSPIEGKGAVILAGVKFPAFDQAAMQEAFDGAAAGLVGIVVRRWLTQGRPFDGCWLRFKDDDAQPANDAPAP